MDFFRTKPFLKLICFSLMSLVCFSVVAGPYLPRMASSRMMMIPVNQGRVIHVQSAVDTVFISDPEIVDYHTKDGHQIYLFAKKVGRVSFYTTDKKGGVTSQYTIDVIQDLKQLQDVLARTFPQVPIRVVPVGNNSIALQGTVLSPDEAENIRLMAAKYMGDPKNVVNLMNVAAPTQINLRVEVIEMARRFERALGLDWLFSYQGANSAFGLRTTLIPTAFTAPPLFNTVDVSGNFTSGNFSLNAMLHLLEDNRLVTILSEPNLTALSGETASFLVGGEFPVVLPQGIGTTPGVMFKQYGVSLAFSPTLLNSGKINIQIKSEVSQLTQEGAVEIQGFKIPALTTRRAQTTVELKSGQSFAIAGLLQNDSEKLFQQLPGIGETPVLGALFRSQEFQRRETELVIIITPYLVTPAGSNQLASAATGLQNEGPANHAAAIRRAIGRNENIGFIL